MLITAFKDKKDIEKTILGIAGLMSAWGMKNTDWMIGKQMNFYFTGIIPDARKIFRDTNVYVLYDKLPWLCRPEVEGRIFPPRNSKFSKQYFSAQKKYNAGFDLMPMPDKVLKTGFINKKLMLVDIQGQKINLESVEKFLNRIIALTDYFFAKTIEDVREYYFADRDRYEKRVQLYLQIRSGIHSEKLKKRMDYAIKGYKKMMEWAYPEIFDSNAVGGNNILSGKVAFFKQENLKGKVVLYDANIKYKKEKEKPIFIFSHFYPADTKILPMAKAVVTEGGGLLCHAAIVAREYEVPTMVGVRGLITAAKNKKNIEIDFKNQKVKLL